LQIGNEPNSMGNILVQKLQYIVKHTFSPLKTHGEGGNIGTVP
jgi:hypothetical protein